jgi:hypothetical protein
VKLEMQADAMLLKGRGITVSIIEHSGKTEVVVQGKENCVRIINDSDGIHVGSLKPNRKILSDD